jgi:acyl-CoA thioester hydrolase
VTFLHHLRVRYRETDAQHVAFNSQYLGWFDDAMTEFLLAHGLPYRSMLDAGFDVQLVRSEIDWKAGVGFGDDIAIVVATARLGRTSFALDFEVRRGEDVTCSGRTVYVVVATDGSGKTGIPPLIRDALGEPEPLRPL